MKKLIKVLILSNMGPSKTKPNSGRFILNQYLGLKKQANCEVGFFYLDQESKVGLAKVLRYPLFFCRFILNYILSRTKQDIIHVHFYFPNILLAVAYKLLRNWQVKIVVTFHGSDIYSYSPPNFIYRVCTHFIDKYIFVSEKLKHRFFKTVPCSVLSAGVSDIFYQKKFAENALLKKQFDIVFVGHLNKNKGIDRLEEILQRFPSKIRVAIVGCGDSSFIERVAKNNNVSISHFEHCTPEQLVTIYNESFLLINLSYKESFGLVMAEAMACGLPVVATETDGACAQVINSKNGFLLTNDENNVCSSAINVILQILNMPEKNYVNMSNSAINSAKPYRLSLITEQIFNIYAKLRVNNVNDE